MKTDDGFLLPPLQPEIPGNPTVVLIHSPVALAPVIEHAPPSVRPELRPWSGLSSPRTRSVSASPRPDGRDAPSPGRRRLRSRRTPSASDRRRWVAVHFPHTARKLGPCLKGVASGWLPSLLRCSACARFSYVLSAILAKERLLHFQARKSSSLQAGVPTGSTR